MSVERQDVHLFVVVAAADMSVVVVVCRRLQ